MSSIKKIVDIVLGYLRCVENIELLLIRSFVHFEDLDTSKKIERTSSTLSISVLEKQLLCTVYMEQQDFGSCNMRMIHCWLSDVSTPDFSPGVLASNQQLVKWPKKDFIFNLVVGFTFKDVTKGSKKTFVLSKERL